MTLQAELKLLRQQIEKLQVEVGGRRALQAMVVWDEQKEDYVKPIPDDFNGLVVHLEPDVAPPVETQTNYIAGVSQNELEELKKQIVRSQRLDS